MFSKVIILFLAMAASVKALVIPYKRSSLLFGPFTPEQKSQFSQGILHLESTGVIQSKREPLPIRHPLHPARITIREGINTPDTPQLGRVALEIKDSYAQPQSVQERTPDGLLAQAFSGYIQWNCAPAYTDACVQNAYANPPF